MDTNIQKEEFSYAYIYAYASAAGYTFQLSTRSVDISGIDASIASITTDEAFYEPRLYLQIKSTSREVLSNDQIRYTLRIKNYNELRKEKTLAPRILVVVLIPDNPYSWVQQSETELCLRNCAYWISPRGMPETQNTDNITLYLPRQQIFTIDALKTLMQRIETGGIL